MGFLPKTLGYLADAGLPPHGLALLFCCHEQLQRQPRFSPLQTGWESALQPAPAPHPGSQEWPQTRRTWALPLPRSQPLSPPPQPLRRMKLHRDLERLISPPKRITPPPPYTGEPAAVSSHFRYVFFFSPSHILLLCIVVMDGRLPNKMYKDDTE